MSVSEVAVEVKKAKHKDILDNKVIVPDGSDSFLNLKKLWAFTGPGFLMSIAYLDPGNIESDLQSGSNAGFRLIWVLLVGHVLGLFLQRLSARLGVVSGKHAAECAYSYYPKVPRLFLWIMVEIAIIGSDMQEVIGTAIALYLLSDKAIPLWAGVLITILDTFTFLFLDKYGIRKFEFFFCFLISVMAVTFGYEFVKSAPPAVDVVKDSVYPWCSDCDIDQVLQAVSIIGAVIMPHNFYLHSALVKSRQVDRSKKERVVEANKYFFIESGIALVCSFFINLLVVSVFGNGLYGKTNADVRQSCHVNDNHMPSFYLDVFDNNTDDATSDIYHGGIFLGCTFGAAALYIWAIGILAAGQSSTMTGTYAGQFAMEGFVQIRISRWKRILITRSLAILPTIFVTIVSQGVDHISGLNDLLNCIQMFQLPFAILPVLAFTASHHIMREFAMSKGEKIFYIVASIVILAINYFFLVEYIYENYDTSIGWAVFAIIMVVYTLLVIYLAYYTLISMGFVEQPSKGKMGRLFPVPDYDAFDAPWLGIVAEDPETGSETSEGDDYSVRKGADNESYDPYL
uniref:Protein Malvolio n=1 Tax=Panagrellus redivivus TaxID=6233 RepID=A0A7E4UNR0_PANRE